MEMRCSFKTPHICYSHPFILNQHAIERLYGTNYRLFFSLKFTVSVHHDLHHNHFICVSGREAARRSAWLSALIHKTAPFPRYPHNGLTQWRLKTIPTGIEKSNRLRGDWMRFTEFMRHIWWIRGLWQLAAILSPGNLAFLGMLTRWECLGCCLRLPVCIRTLSCITVARLHSNLVINQ